MLDPRSWRFAAPGLLLPLLALLAGCQGPAVDESSEDADEDVAGVEAAAAPEAPLEGGKRGRHAMDRGHDNGGPDFLFRAALNELELSQDQRTTIEAARSGLRAPDGAVKPEGKGEMFGALAGAVRSGAIDEAALQPAFDAAATAGAARRERAVVAIQKLHDALTASQRSALVTAIEARQQARADEHADQGECGKRGGDHAERGQRGPLGHLLGGLALSDAQRAKIDAQLASAHDAGRTERPSFEAMRSARQTALAAFAGDSFDAQAMLPPNERKDEHVQGLVRALAAIVPVLDDSQRAQLAARLEHGPRMEKDRGAAADPGAPEEE